MKRVIFYGLAVFILAFCLIGCDRDGANEDSSGGGDNNTTSLAGTTWVWETIYAGTTQKLTYKFVSTSAGIFTHEAAGESGSSNFTYTRSGNTITIFWPGGSTETGTLSGNRLYITDGNTGETYVFIKV